MKNRRHHNNDGRQQVKRGKCAEQVERMAKLLKIQARATRRRLPIIDTPPKCMEPNSRGEYC